MSTPTLADRISAPESERNSALRSYEAAHKTWMNSVVHTPEGQKAKAALAAADQRLSNVTRELDKLKEGR